MTPPDFNAALKALEGTAPRTGASGGIRLDDYMNLITGIGVAGKDKRKGVTFQAVTVSDVDASELWRGDDLASRVIETVPNEMLREGFEVRIGDDKRAKRKAKSRRLPGEPAEPESEDESYKEAAARGDALGWLKRRRVRLDAEQAATDLAKDVCSKLEDLGAAAAILLALQYERAYGGAAILLGVTDGVSDLKQPLKPERVRGIEFLTVLEPRECQPIAWYNDPLKPKFGEPALYEINPQSPGGTVQRGTVQVHESRLIVFPGIKVTRRMVNGPIPGWGDSVLTRVQRVLDDYNLSWSATAILINDYSQSVIKIKGLYEMMTGREEDVKKLKDRMVGVEASRSVAHAVIIDAEEEYERKTTPVTGLEALLDRFSSRLAAACDMPLTLLMGQSPGGLNATGESDVRFFYDRVAALQDKRLRPVLERLIKIVFKALGKQEPDSWSVHFRPLWQPTDKEAAEAREIQSRTDERYINLQVVSPEEIAINRFGDDEYSFATVIDWDARAAAEPVADPPAKTEAQLEQEQADRDAMTRELDIKQGAVDAKSGGPASLRKPEPTDE